MKRVTLLVIGLLISFSIYSQTVKNIPKNWYPGIETGKMLDYSVRLMWMYELTPYEKIVIIRFGKSDGNYYLMPTYSFSEGFFMDSTRNGGFVTTNFYFDKETPLKLYFKDKTIELYPAMKFTSTTFNRATSVGVAAEIIKGNSVFINTYYKLTEEDTEILNENNLISFESYFKTENGEVHTFGKQIIDTKKIDKTNKMLIKLNKL